MESILPWRNAPKIRHIWQRYDGAIQDYQSVNGSARDSNAMDKHGPINQEWSTPTSVCNNIQIVWNRNGESYPADLTVANVS